MGYLSIGDTMSPEDVRQGDIIRFVVARRKAGASDSEILEQLRSSNVTRSHPCADVSGQHNVCSIDEISNAMLRASSSVGKIIDGDPSSIQKASFMSPKTILIAGAGAAVLWFFAQRKK